METQRKILIVGEHSYIGKSIKNYMESHPIYASGWKVDMTGGRDESWKQVDFSKYTAVIHVAALVHRKEGKEEKTLYYQINTEFPVQVAKKAKKAGVSEFFFFSTMAVYGEIDGRITEKTPLKPVTMYGKSKMEAEKRLLQLRTKDFRVVILRPPMVYGPDCPGNYARLEKMAEYVPVFPKVDNKRSMIHIEALCACICEELGKSESKIICPSDAKPVCTTKMYVEMRRKKGKKTYTVKGLSGIIRKGSSKIGVLRKMFGDCYYEKNEI